jgi:hypothetical protein
MMSLARRRWKTGSHTAVVMVLSVFWPGAKREPGAAITAALLNILFETEAR